MLEARIQPFVERTYGGRMACFDMFIVRYRMDKQRRLEEHIDGGHVSFDILLSPADEYEGGGVWYKELNRTLITERGHVLVHPAKVRHAGTAITSGQRYVLVGFTWIKPSSIRQMFVLFWRLWGFLASTVELQTVDAPVFDDGKARLITIPFSA